MKRAFDACTPILETLPESLQDYETYQRHTPLELMHLPLELNWE